MNFWSSRSHCALIALGLLIVAAPVTQASTTFYTSSADFSSAISGLTPSFEDYSGFAAGDLVNSGDTFNNLTYSNFVGSTLQGGVITDVFASISGLSLGGNQSNGSQFFFGQDQFTVSFATPVYAFGIFFNVNPNSGSYAVSTSVGDGSTGSASYDIDTFVFVGVVSTTSFTSATISSTDPSLGSFNIPEIITASVPEPSTLTMGLLSIIVVSAPVIRSWRQRMRDKRNI